MPSVEETINRALVAAGLTDGSSAVRRVIDAALVKAGLSAPPAVPLSPATPVLKEIDGTQVPGVDADANAAPRGTFETHTCETGSDSLNYKLYVPSSHRGQPVPLMVMLHGCKQDPDDFAAGTRMNRLADMHGFLVAYPAQTRRANGSNCWNWFVSREQQRDGREPSLIAGVVGDVARRVATDRGKVFAAGLSAGGAMAQILGHRYPDIFAGVGVHSGLPVGAAHDVPSAFAAMRGQAAARQAGAHGLSPGRGVRTLVLHGMADATVAPSNGEAVVTQALASFEGAGSSLRRLDPVIRTREGRRCTRTDHVDAAGILCVRDWKVQGGGHAWFGGSSAGSFTDEAGPDASAELVAFFLGEAVG